MISKLRSLSVKQISLAIATASVLGTVGVVGVTHAAPADKPTKEQCKAAGYTNYGQCVKVWAQGHGYESHGEDTTVEEIHSVHTIKHTWSSFFHFW